MVFHPKKFHLSDGDVFSEKDLHFNLGKRNMDLVGFLSVIPNGGLGRDLTAFLTPNKS